MTGSGYWDGQGMPSVVLLRSGVARNAHKVQGEWWLEPLLLRAATTAATHCHHCFCCHCRCHLGARAAATTAAAPTGATNAATIAAATMPLLFPCCCRHSPHVGMSQMGLVSKMPITVRHPPYPITSDHRPGGGRLSLPPSDRRRHVS